MQPNLHLGKGDPCFCRRAALGYQMGGPASSQTTPHTEVRVLNLVMHSRGMDGYRRVFRNGLGRAPQCISSCVVRGRGTLALGPPGGLRHLWEGKGHRESLWWLGGTRGHGRPLAGCWLVEELGLCPRLPRELLGPDAGRGGEVKGQQSRRLQPGRGGYAGKISRLPHWVLFPEGLCNRHTHDCTLLCPRAQQLAVALQQLWGD